MQRAWILLLIAGCEHAPIGEVVFAPPAVVESPELRTQIVVQQEPPPEIELPAAPARGMSYPSWLAMLTPAQERGMIVYCTRHPWWPEARCGGIGPLHIPPRPSRKRGELAFQEWNTGLSQAQRSYIDDRCEYDYEHPLLCGENTPLVVAFGDAPIVFHARATFAFVAGHPIATDWPSAPWLALDRDGDGAITSGAELFGNHTAPGMRNGFDALAALDANRDGRIDRDDPAYAELLLWTDRDGDGASSPAELARLSSAVESISLTAQLDPRCDARGNCEGERAAMRTTSGQHGSVVDVYVLPSAR